MTYAKASGFVNRISSIMGLSQFDTDQDFGPALQTYIRNDRDDLVSTSVRDRTFHTECLSAALHRLPSVETLTALAIEFCHETNDERIILKMMDQLPGGRTFTCVEKGLGRNIRVRSLINKPQTVTRVLPLWQVIKHADKIPASTCPQHLALDASGKLAYEMNAFGYNKRVEGTLLGDENLVVFYFFGRHDEVLARVKYPVLGRVSWEGNP